MSAVRKEKSPDLIPFAKEEPSFPFIPESEMMCPPMQGKYTHTEDELRSMWDRIWRCFKSKKLCKSFMFYNKVHSLEVWCAAFETVRQNNEGGFDNVIRYAKRIGDSYEIKGTPAQVALREAEKVDQARRAMSYQGVDPDDPDIQAFERRSDVRPLDEMADHPMTLRYQNRNRGCK